MVSVQGYTKIDFVLVFPFSKFNTETKLQCSYILRDTGKVILYNVFICAIFVKILARKYEIKQKSVN